MSQVHDYTVLALAIYDKNCNIAVNVFLAA